MPAMSTGAEGTETGDAEIRTGGGVTVIGDEVTRIGGVEKSMNAEIRIGGDQKPKLAAILTGDGLIPTPPSRLEEIRIGEEMRLCQSVRR